MFVLISSAGFTRQARVAAQASGIQLLEIAELEHPKASPVERLSNFGPAQRRLSSPNSRRTVFVSYSHKDRRALDRLQVHVRPLERDGLIDLWADTRLQAGDRWREDISSALQRARVAVLLVSADFLASDFIAEDELPPLLARAKSEGARILPVILSSCGFTRHPSLSGFQAVNDPERPLAELSRADRERMWDSVAQDIIESVRNG